NEGDEIEMKDKGIARLQAKIEKIEAAAEKLRQKYEGKKPAPKKPAAPRKKAPAKAEAPAGEAK
ncbi:alpha-amylase, partial [Bacillus pumilus]